VEWLEARRAQPRLKRDLAEVLQRPDLSADDEALGDCELLVAFGGDGTLLAASRIAAPRGVPVLGIHAGGPASFGFLTEATPPRALEVLDAVLEGRCRVEERVMVAATVTRNGETLAQVHAQNDLVIRAQARMLKMRVEVGGTYIATYAADGIIVATPTGSTAYNLAAGGPLVHPTVEALMLTPICPHTLNVRSLLVNIHDTIRVRMEKQERDVTLLTVDGQISSELEPLDEIEFRRSERHGRFITLDGTNFYEKVQTRLRLGERFGS
jgi:NAD+ kinase